MIRELIQRVIGDVSSDDLCAKSSYATTIKLILDSATRDLDRFKRRGGWNVLMGHDFSICYDGTHAAEYEWCGTRIIVFYS